MSAIYSLSGILSIVGGLLAVGVFIFIPQLKTNYSALTRASRLSVFITIAILVLGGVAALFTHKLEPGKPVLAEHVGTGEEPKPSAGTLSGEVNQQAASITKDVPLSEMFSEHASPFNPTTRSFDRIVEATPGYRIARAEIIDVQQARLSDLTVEITDNGAAAVVHFRLTSGPQFDRYGGSIDATLRLTERRVPSSAFQASGTKQ
ncbi:hypothetical protein PQR08_37005 [Caballeronia jiangsuensis]|uniref:Uncharacterized protein n=1 Tax=Caballeronia jiangsuensis TaxID=1458357 RepID=A0ABW9CWQ9_9BURK